jgi:predicted dehydrogenase
MPSLAFLSTAHIHTKSFIEGIVKATDGRKVAAIWDDVPDRGQRYADSAGAPFVPDIEAVLEDKSVDGFIICSENTRHLPLLKKVLPMGKPVFCEKPLVTNNQDLKELRILLKNHPTPLFAGYFQPFTDIMQAVSARINEGYFGKITSIRFRNAHHAAYGRWFDNPDLAWFYQPELSGGGAFMDMGTHAVHFVRTLFGPAQEVSATIGNYSGQYPTCDDYGLALVKFASGCLGTIEASWVQTGGIGGLEITGSEKCLWNTPAGYVCGSPGKPAEPWVADQFVARPSRVDRLVAVIRHEISEVELADDLGASLDTVAIMEAAYASARTRQWERVAVDLGDN